MMMNECFIGIGSNFSTDEYVQRACLSLRTLFQNIVFSQMLMTAPVDWISESKFRNMVVYCNTQLSATDLIAKLKQIEQELGRTKEDKDKGVVLIDLDLLSYNGAIIKQNDWNRDDVIKCVNELREQYIRGSAFVNPDAPDAVYEPDEGLTDMLNEAGFEEDDVRVPFLLGRGYDIPTKEAAARYFGEPMTEKEFKKFKEKYGK